MQCRQLKGLKTLLLVSLLLLTASMLASCGDDDPTAPTITNHSPGVPTLNTAAGAPADDAIAVNLNPTLHWNCTDSDGDTLTYAIHFGQEVSPGVVSASQPGTSYSLTNLDFDTTYYWKIVARDNSGLSSSSPTWSFTTVTEGAETITRPGIPNGAANTVTETLEIYQITRAYSSMDHDLQYQFNWGDGNTSDWSQALNASHTWTAGGTFSVTAQARCAEHTDILSLFTTGFNVTVVGPEGVSTPNAPEGPTTGETMTSLIYYFTGAESSYGHALYYRLDDGDGNISTWHGGTSRGVFWTSPGTYEVKVQAVCQNHPDVISAWSEALSVTISDPAEIIQQPHFVNYSPTIGGINDDLSFGVLDVSSNLMHALEVQFNWDDGSFSDWIPVISERASETHSWTTGGTYQVKAMARCIEHPSAVSEWVTFPEMVIAETEEITTPIQIPADEQTADINEWVQFDIPGVTSNMGHLLEYMFDYGDGRTSIWQGYSDQSGKIIRYSEYGDYEVRSQVRCIEHPDVISDWSVPSIVHVVEMEHISAPVLSGPSSGTVGIPVEFTVSGAESSFGHELEYQLTWSHTWPPYGPNYQEWTTADNLNITWDSPSGSIFVVVTARCVEDPELTQVGNYLFLQIIEE